MKPRSSQLGTTILVLLIATASCGMGADPADTSTGIPSPLTTVSDDEHITGYLQVDGDLQVGGRTTVPSITFVSASEGLLSSSPYSTYEQLDNFSPSAIATNKVIYVRASDDAGTVITGIDASSIQLDDERTFCNVNGQNDDAVLSLRNLDTASLAANRILTPAAGNIGNIGRSDFYIGPDECATLVYAAPDVTAPAFRAWIVKDANVRFAHIVTRQLQFYPSYYAAALSGTTHNYVPTPSGTGVYTCPTSSGGSVSCGEAGNDLDAESSTIINLRTATGAAATLTGLAYTFSKPYSNGPVKILTNLGPGDIILKNCGAGSGVNNQFQFNANGSASYDVVMKPNAVPVMLFHERDNGRWIALGKYDYVFEGHNVTMNEGAVIKQGAQAQAIDISRGDIATTLDTAAVRINDTSTMDASSSSRAGTGLSVTQGASRSSAGGTVVNIAADFEAKNGTDNYALRTKSGKVYLGQGGATTLMYANFPYVDFAHDHKVEGNLVVGNGDFAGATTAHVGTTGTAASLTTCGTGATISGSDISGRFTVGTGTTTCTLTFARTYTVIPSCRVTAENGTPPAWTPTAGSLGFMVVAAGASYDYDCNFLSGGS
jgi:hypothetical protein